MEHRGHEEMHVVNSDTHGQQINYGIGFTAPDRSQENISHIITPPPPPPAWTVGRLGSWIYAVDTKFSPYHLQQRFMVKVTEIIFPPIN